MLSSFVATKLYIPPLRPDYIARPRLVDVLHSGFHAGRRLTLVSAPAGYGKTSLLSEWVTRLNADQVPLVWLSLEENDNDPGRFLHYLLAALRSHFTKLGNELINLLDLPQPPAPLEIAVSLVNEMSQMNTPVVLVLDDYHLIRNPAIHEVVAFMIDRGPVQLHLVIASRHDPLLPLPRLRARGLVTELRLKDLRFRNNEAAAFLQKGIGLELAAANLAALQDRTEGWAAGLQLAAISLSDGETSSDAFIQTFQGDDRHILDYLLEEVLSRQTEQVQQFLQDTSILEKFCAGLCDAVRNQPESASYINAPDLAVNPSVQILDYLDQSNLFLIPLDNRRGWFRYHHLFSEALKYRLQHKDPNRYIQLHRRAAQWFDQNDLPGPAFEHALAAQDTHLAADIAEHWLDSIIFEGQISLGKSWLNSLSEALLQERPELLLQKARIYSRMGDAVTHFQALDDLERCLERMPDPFPRRPHLWVLSSTSRANTMISRGSLEQASQLIERAERWLPAGEPGLHALIVDARGYQAMVMGDMEQAEAAEMEMARISLQTKSFLGVFGGLSMAMQCAMFQGKVHRAAQIADDFLSEYSQEVKDLPALGLVTAEMGNVAYALNELDRAESLLQQTLDLIKSGGIGDITGRWRTQLAEVKAALGKNDEVEQLLREAEPWLMRSTNERAKLRTRTYAARIRIHQGNLAQAAIWADQYQAVMEQPYRMDHQDNTLAWIWICQGKVLEALHLLESRAPGMQEKKIYYFLIENLSLQAVALQRLSQQSAAFETMQRALHLAESENLVRVFLDIGFELALLLTRLKASLNANDPLQGYLGRILACLPEQDRLALPAAESTAVVLPSKKDEWVETLSEREIDVLRWMARGFSNSQIAEHMVVAESTVKKHINHIFGKLDAENRTQALIKARERGLL